MQKPHQYDYPRPALTSDLVIFRKTSHGTPEVLLIQRKAEPFENHWALPGGFCDQGETTHQAAVRELLEETGCKADRLTLIHVADQPGRDPRGWTVSACFLGWVPEGTTAVAGDDARDARWFLIDGLPEKLAFDHHQILAVAVEKINEQNLLRDAKLALEANRVFHTPIEKRKHGGEWNEYQQDAIRRTLCVLDRTGHISDPGH